MDEPCRLRTFRETGCAGARDTTGAITRPELGIGIPLTHDDVPTRGDPLPPGGSAARGAQHGSRHSAIGELGGDAPIGSFVDARF